MNQLLEAAEHSNMNDYCALDKVITEEVQDFVDFLAEEDLVNTTKARALDRMDSDYYGHAQHIEMGDTTYHLITLLTPVKMVMFHEVAHLLVYKADPEFSKTHQNDHGDRFEAALTDTIKLYNTFKGGKR